MNNRATIQPQQWKSPKFIWRQSGLAKALPFWTASKNHAKRGPWMVFYYYYYDLNKPIVGSKQAQIWADMPKQIHPSFWEP